MNGTVFGHKYQSKRDIGIRNATVSLINHIGCSAVVYSSLFVNSLSLSHHKIVYLIKTRDDSGYGLTGYRSYGFVTSYTILTVYYCNRSNLALFNRY